MQGLESQGVRTAKKNLLVGGTKLGDPRRWNRMIPFSHRCAVPEHDMTSSIFSTHFPF